MLDINVLITIVPPVLTAILGYLIARKKTDASEKIGKARLDADVQTKALQIVRSVMSDIRKELKREIDALRTENKSLREEIEENKRRLQDLQNQLVISDELIETLRSEISSLKKTLALYEAEIDRLRRM